MSAVPLPTWPDYETDDVLVVAERSQLRALGNDLRSRIVALLRERARSTQELAEELGLPKGTVGHHVKVLERVGLIRVVRTRQVRAVTEKFYGRTARLFLFQGEDPTEERALGAAALRSAGDELARATETTTFGWVRARLAPADVQRFERRIRRLLDEFGERESAEGDIYSLAAGMWTTERRDA
jgi:DNA-binding transcriptional ArsR family regulator